MHEPQLGVTHVIQQHLRPEHVGEDELRRTENRPVDVRLGGEVDDRVAVLRRTGDGIRIGDVAVMKLVLDAFEVGPAAGVGELVEDHDVLATIGEAPGEVRPDEARAAGDENAHRYRVLTAAPGTPGGPRASAGARARLARCAGPSTPGAPPGRRTPRS